MTDNSMGLDLPSASTLTPEYVEKNNTAFNVVAEHNHTEGSGVLIPASAININADLSFSSNDATTLRSTRYVAQTSAFTGGVDVNAVYSLNGELVWRDASGNNVQLTDNGGINIASVGTIGGDYGQPGVAASATYSDTTKYFSWTRSAGVGAGMSMSNIKLLYPTAGQQAVTVSTPTGVTAHEIILPATVASTAGSVWTIGTDGQVAFTKTLSNMSLGASTLTGTTTNSGTISGGTVTGAALASPTLSGFITSTATIQGGTVQSIELGGTISGAPTFSGQITVTSPIVTNATATTIAGYNGSKSLITAAQTGTGATVVVQTSPTINTPTVTSPTVSGTLTASSLTLSGTVTGGTLASPTITSPTVSGTLTASSLTLSGTISSGTYASPTISSPSISAASVTGTSTWNGGFAGSIIGVPTIRTSLEAGSVYARVGGVFYSNGLPVSSSGTSETTLMTYTIPAGALSTSSAATLEVEYWINIAGTGGGPTLTCKVYFGSQSQTVFTLGPTSGSQYIYIKHTIWMLDNASSQQLRFYALGQAGTYTFAGGTGASENTANATVIKVTGTDAGGNGNIACGKMIARYTGITGN